MPLFQLLLIIGLVAPPLLKSHVNSQQRNSNTVEPLLKDSLN